MRRGRLSLLACARRCELFGAMMLGALIVATMLCLAGCSAPASSEDAHDVALTGAATLGRVSVGCPDGLMERARDDESRQVTTTTPDGASKSYGHKQAFYDKGDSMTMEEDVAMLMLHEHEGVTFEEALAYAQDKARTGVEDAVANASQTEGRWHLQEGMVANTMEGVAFAEPEMLAVGGHDACAAFMTKKIGGELVAASMTCCIRLDENAIGVIELVDQGKYTVRDGRIELIEPLDEASFEALADALIASVVVS